MGTHKAINGKLQFYLILLLLMVIIITATPVFNEKILLYLLIAFLCGCLTIMSIAKKYTDTSIKTEQKLLTQIKTCDEELEKLSTQLHVSQQHLVQMETQKSLTSIVSGFAHEINNPLTGILGYIDLMELNDDLSLYSKKRLEGIKDQAIRIKNIIDELNWLDPELEQIKSEIDMSNMLEKMIKIISQEQRAKNITFEKNFTDEELIVNGNHFALWQVFEGIIENSIEAIRETNPTPGIIRVILKKSAENSIAEIEDNAGGFTSLEKAFNPFYTTKSRTHKRGIGLAIAFNVVLEHKGNIQIKNNPEGAVVSVTLPCCPMVTEQIENQSGSTIHHKNQILEEK